MKHKLKLAKEKFFASKPEYVEYHCDCGLIVCVMEGANYCYYFCKVDSKHMSKTGYFSPTPFCSIIINPWNRIDREFTGEVNCESLINEINMQEVLE